MPFHQIVLAFSIVCIVAVLFFERKNPASSLVWVLVLLFFPGIGFVLYLFLGSGYRVNKHKKYRLKAEFDTLYDTHIKKHLNFSRSRIFIEHHKNASRLLTYLKNQGDGVFTDDNNAAIFTDGAELFARMMEEMRHAKAHIHLLFYIFRNDSLGREILSILEEKAKEGVEVRLLYDSVGTMMASDKLFRKLKRAGGQVRAFSPLFSSLSSHLRLNYRNHRKIAVIDGLAGYVGGMNVGDEYRGRDPVLAPWRDTHLRLTGSAVWFLQERFFMDWAYSSDENPHHLDIDKYFPEPLEEGAMPMQIVASGPDIHESPIKSGMLSMIYGAQKSIHLQTPYFTPDDSFADALRIAARSNVDVRIMIPRLSDYWIVQKATMGFVRDLRECGVKVYLYDGFIHAKTMVVDGEVATIGTTNITTRSFTLDFEVNAFIYDRAFAEECELIFLADCARSDPVSDGYFTGQGRLARAAYNVTRLLTPLM